LDLAIDRTNLREVSAHIDSDDNNPTTEFLSGPFVQSSPYYNRSVAFVQTADNKRGGKLMTSAGASLQGGLWHVDGQHPHLNLFNWSDPTTDRLLNEYRDAHGDTAAQDAYHALHEHLYSERPYLFLWHHNTKSAWRNEVRNNVVAPYYYFQDFSGWRL
jgi:ABC-type transport system substrate-binding protein